jgi:hypothetical protein
MNRGIEDAEIERVRRQQALVNARIANAAGVSLEKSIAEREEAAKHWTHVLRTLMKTHRAADPVEVLPQILALIEQQAAGTARRAAKAVVKTELQALLRKMLAG